MKTASPTHDADRQCLACAYVFGPDDPAHPAACPNCRRPLRDEVAYRMRRLLSFILGILTQVLVGLLAWYFPPGSSAGSWGLYLGLGIFGCVQVIWGARGWRHAGGDAERPAVTADFEPDDIPYHAKQCRHCGHNLSATISKGARRCPNCSAHFSLRDLGWRAVDPKGEPISYAPHEKRLKGPVLVAFVVGVFLVIALGFWGMRVGQQTATSPVRPSPGAPANATP